MEASMGSGPVKRSRNVLQSSSYSYFIWFLIGCMAHFGLQLFVLSCSIFTDVLEVSSNYCGSFLANMVALAIMSSYIGFLVSHTLFPFKKITLEFSFIIASISLVLLCLVNVVDKKLGRVVYIIAMFVGCFSFGVMESVGITTASDPDLQGRPPKRVIFFLCGHPLGYALVLLIHLMIENSSFSFYINSCGYTGAIYSCYGIFILLLCGVPVVIFVIISQYPTKGRKPIWQDTNIVNSTLYYADALRLLSRYGHYIVILVVIEATEVILNWRIVLFLHDPYPKFDSIMCSLSIVMGYAIFDLVGRGFSIGVRRMVSDLKDRTRIMVKTSKGEDLKKGEESQDEKGKVNEPDTPENVLKDGKGLKENEAEPTILEDLEKGIDDKLDQDPELRNKFRLRLYRNFLRFMWLPITFRIITGVIIFMQRHHPESLALENYTNMQGTIMLTMINAFVRGVIVSYVYSNLFEVSKTDYLKEHKVTVNPVVGEAEGCADMRYNAYATGSILVSIVRMIDLSVMLLLVYVFYKYNRLLFDVSEVYNERKIWATDHLSSNLSKFFWWVRSILYLIWRDVRSPFELN